MKDENHKTQVLCPSSKCKDGAQLIGIVREDGAVNMLQEAITITQDFVDTANLGRKPEMRFRFAGKCIKNGCAQWTGERCGIIDKIMDYVEDKVESSSEDNQFSQLPNCSIRSQCRWFKQRGGEACKVCPMVITDVTTL